MEVFFYRNGTMHDLGTLGGRNSRAIRFAHRGLGAEALTPSQLFRKFAAKSLRRVGSCAFTRIL
jgi:hypothetical protein